MQAEAAKPSVADIDMNLLIRKGPREHVELPEGVRISARDPRWVEELRKSGYSFSDGNPDLILMIGELDARLQRVERLLEALNDR